MAILGAYIVPHPPLIIPEVGRGNEKAIQSTIDSYNEVARKIASLKPDTIVVISPHTTIYADYFHISPGIRASGDMAQFSAPEVNMEVRYDDRLAMTISGESTAEGIFAGTQGEQDKKLDHATFIPLYFVNKYYTDYKVVRCGFSGMGPLEHLKFGRAIRYAADDLGRNIVIIASGDLSHKLKEDGPYGFAAEGPVFDEYIVKAIKQADLLAFLTAPQDICSGAAECGLNSFRIMAGALEGYDIESEFYSYEGPFGVGYAVGSFKPHPAGKDDRSVTCEVAGTAQTTGNNGYSAAKDLETAYTEQFKYQMDLARKGESPIVSFARNYLEKYIKTGIKSDVSDFAEELVQGTEPAKSELASFAKTKAGAFVSIKKHGQLRGCIGTTEAIRSDLLHEVAENAISAGIHDPRFMPIKEDELPELTYSVDVLGAAEPIDDMSYLDPSEYGVIVTSGSKRGLLLPDLEGVDTAMQQVEIACSKAGITEDEEISLERFKVTRYK